MAGGSCRRLDVEGNHVIVSSDDETVIVGRAGDVLQRRAPDRLALPSLGEYRYSLDEGELVELDSRGVERARAALPVEPFARYRDRLLEELGGSAWLNGDGEPGWRAAIAELADHMIQDVWRGVGLVADPPRGRLLVVGWSYPWLAALRTNGAVDWVTVVGRYGSCCNDVCVMSDGKTFAHFSSCGARLTFLSANGDIEFQYEVRPFSSNLRTTGAGVAQIVVPDEGIAEYRPGAGLVRMLEVPGIRDAVRADGITFAAIQDQERRLSLVAFDDAI
jgi:hypothetical protein